VARDGQRPDDLAVDDQRRVDAGAQRVVVDWPGEGAGEVEAGVGRRVLGQDVVDLAHEERPDRALRHGRVGRGAPRRVDPGLVGGVDLAVVADDADVEMVVGDDLGHLGRDSADGRQEVELPRDGAGDAEELVEPRIGPLRVHLDLLPRP
jgi:hypothetical protein